MHVHSIRCTEVAGCTLFRVVVTPGLTPKMGSPEVVPRDESKTLSLTQDQLLKLIQDGVTRGIQIGESGTKGDYTEIGTAAHVMMDAGLL